MVSVKPKTTSDAASWDEIKEFFVNSEDKMTYDQVAERFHLSQSRVQTKAYEQDWPSLRRKFQEGQLAASNAAVAIRKACSQDQTVVERLVEVGLACLNAVELGLRKLAESEASPRAHMDIANTSTFAVANLAKTFDTIGIFGLHDKLTRAGQDAGGADGHGKWDKGLLQQINVTVQGMTARVDAAAAKAAEVPAAVDTGDAPP